MSEGRSSSGGIGVVGLLGVLFVGLKLGGVISWSWIWVTAPFWIGLALLLLGLAVCGSILVIAAFTDQVITRRKRAKRIRNASKLHTRGRK